MTFEFSASSDFDFITGFSEQFHLPVHDNLLLIPETMGEGYIRKIMFDNDFRLLIHRYKFTEDFIIRRNPASEPNDVITIFFYSNEQPIDLVYNQDQPIKFSQKNDSAIQVTTSNLQSVIRFPANTETHYVVVGIASQKLAKLLSLESTNHVLQTITNGSSSFLYFESMNSETQQLLQNIVAMSMNDALSIFHAHIRVLELLYLLFHRLLKRENTFQAAINNADAEKLMVIRNIILADLSKPPVIDPLANTVGMSKTKLKQLFKQTFGDTMYNYFQKVRMDEAAFLLRQAGYSVSEVGYQLGFSNLSHFSRLFAKHYGITPKKYSNV